MTKLRIEKLHEDFGARISGIDLREKLTEADVEDIHAAIDTYSFLCFPDQPLNDARQLAVTSLLGEPEANHVSLGRDGKIAYFGTIGNVMEDGEKLGNAHNRTLFQTGNNMWHSDSSFRENPSFVSIMCAYEVPAQGGETEFISCRAAYRRLDTATQEKIDPLICVHDYVFSRSKVHPEAVSPSHAASLPPVPQKLVRRNSRSGEKNFYGGSHAKTIVGWNRKDSRALLDELHEQATQPEHIYSHAWQANDFVIWDNRCLLHRGSGYDADKYRRHMRQTRVAGAGSTLNEE